MIAHLDCDAFYVSVELLRRPDLVGKPVVVAGSGPRAVVTTASYEARRYGVGSASPAAQARRLCPQAVFLPPDFEAYRRSRARSGSSSRARLPVVSQVGLDEGYADVTECEKPLRVLRELVAEVRARTGITHLGRRRAEPADRQGRLRPREAARLRGHGARGGLPAARRARRRGSSPASGPRRSSGSPRSATRRSARIQQADPEDARAPLRRPPRARPARRGRTSTAPTSSRPESGPAKSRSQRDDVRPRHRRPGRARGGARAGWRPSSPRACASKAIRGRTVAIKVRLDDWTTVTRARTLPVAVSDTETIAGVAVELLRAYAPAAARAAARRAHGGLHGRGGRRARPPRRISSRCRSSVGTSQRRGDAAVAPQAQRVARMEPWPPKPRRCGRWRRSGRTRGRRRRARGR